MGYGHLLCQGDYGTHGHLPACHKLFFEGMPNDGIFSPSFPDSCSKLEHLHGILHFSTLLDENSLIKRVLNQKITITDRTQALT